MQKVPYLLIILTSIFLSACSSTTKNESGNEIVPQSEKVLIVSRPIKNKFVITQEFKPKKNRKHKGMDIAGSKGDPILAMADGKVIYKGNRFSGYGYMILIEHSYGLSTLYSHLSQIYVKSGQMVKSGEVIGAMGRTGRATGVHLHFEVMENKVPINPRKYVKF